MTSPCPSKYLITISPFDASRCTWTSSCRISGSTKVSEEGASSAFEGVPETGGGVLFPLATEGEAVAVVGGVSANRAPAGSTLCTGLMLIGKQLRNAAGRRLAASLAKRLLQQLQHELLLLVGLGQCGDAGLFQDRVFGQVRHRGRNIGRRDGVFCRRQVLSLAAD